MSEKKKRKDLFEKWVDAGVVDNKLAIAQSLSMQGQSTSQIAEALEMSRKTLHNLQVKHPSLKKALDSGRLTVVAMCQNKLMERVNSGDTTAIIYALKVYGGDFFNDRKPLDNKSNASSVSVQPQVLVYLPKKAEDGENGSQ